MPIGVWFPMDKWNIWIELVSKNSWPGVRYKKVVASYLHVRASFFPGPSNNATKQRYQSCNLKFSGERLVPSAKHTHHAMMLIPFEENLHATMTRLYTVILHGTNKKHDVQTSSANKHVKLENAWNPLQQKIWILFHTTQDAFLRINLIPISKAYFEYPKETSNQHRSNPHKKKNTLDMKSLWKYSPNKTSSRKNDWNKFKG